MTLAVLLGVIGAAATGNLGALAAPKPPVSSTPTITSGPTGAVSSTSATFAFSSSQSGATFKCQLDSAAYATCTTGKTYTSLAQGAHTFRVKATVSGSTESSAATRTWTVDTVAPAKPVVTSGPDNPSDPASAGFDYTDADSSAEFQCSLDGSPFTGCTKNHTQYPKTSVGDHCFRVRAIDAAGNLSPVSDPWCWTTALDGFPVTGTPAGPFFPGKTQKVNLQIGNPNNFALRILDVQITVQNATKHPDGTASDCVGSQNLVVAQALQISPVAVVVPKNSTKTLAQLGIPESQWPELRMPNHPYSQDECKNTVFNLTYTGTGTK